MDEKLTKQLLDMTIRWNDVIEKTAEDLVKNKPVDQLQQGFYLGALEGYEQCVQELTRLLTAVLADQEVSSNFEI